MTPLRDSKLQTLRLPTALIDDLTGVSDDLKVTRTMLMRQVLSLFARRMKETGKLPAEIAALKAAY